MVKNVNWLTEAGSVPLPSGRKKLQSRNKLRVFPYIHPDGPAHGGVAHKVPSRLATGAAVERPVTRFVGRETA